MTKTSRWWATFLLISTVEILLLFKLLNSQTSIDLLLAIGLVAVLIVITLRIEDVNNISVTKDGLKAELSKIADQVEGKVNQVENNIKDQVNQLGDDINSLLISTVLDAYEYITLQKIVGREQNDKYDFNHPKGQDLLERLRNRGLIDEIDDNTIFNNRSNREINLKQYFLITGRGEKYLKALNQKGLDKELDIIAKRADF